MKINFKSRLVIIFSNIVYYFLIKTNCYHSRGIRVLCYHDINTDKTDDDIFSVSVEEFKRQIDFLYKEKYSVISLKEFLEIIQNKKKYNHKSLLLTFDDGFKSFYSIVLPILKEFQYPATLFLTTQFINKESNYLKWDEILECYKSNLVSIGAHGLSHVNLENIPIDIALKEITGSKKIIQQKLGIEVESFAYPYGSYNTQLKKMVKNVGFKVAFTTKIGENSLNTDPFTLRRVTIFNFDSLSTFKKKLLGAYDWRGLF